MNDDWKFASAIIAVIAAVIMAIAGMFWVFPQWNVYASRMSGEAKLAHAQAEKEVQVRQAQAEEEAAQHRANAIKIVGQAAKDFPEYRQQEFIGAFAEALHGGKVNQLIYVPTEFGIPVLQSGKH